MIKTRLLTFKIAMIAAFILGISTITAQAGFLYVLNDNTTGNTIYGFSVDETTGAVAPLGGFPVATGFAGGGLTNLEMITIDSTNERLYAVNRGSANVSAYSIDPATGAISPLPFSPITVVAAPRIVEVHPSGSPLLVAGDTVDSFVITSTTATRAVGSPFAVGANVSPAGATFSRDGNYFYTAGNTGNFFAGFSVDPASGVLTTLAGSPYDSGNQTPNPTTTDAAGRLFVINSRQALTRVYTTAAGIPTATTGTPYANGMSSFASLGVVHPNGNLFFLADRTANRVSSYTIGGSGAATTLTTVAGSPFASGGTVSSTLTLNSDGKFLFIGNGGTRNITTYTVDPLTGVLSGQVVMAANTAGTAGNLNGIAYANFAVPSFAVTVGGNVSSADGQPIGRALVTVSTTAGVPLGSARTGTFGNYSFPALITGHSYIFAVQSKGFSFAPQTVAIATARDDLNFVSQP